VAPEEQDWLAGGQVGRPHGLDGSFYVGRPRADLLRTGLTVRLGARDTQIVRRAGTDARPIVRVAGVDDRDGAEALRGTELLVPRSAAPPLEEDEWWATDLEGCRVVDGDRALGRVRRLLAMPSCEVLEVEAGADGELFLVPLVRYAVRAVDVEAKVIDVDSAFLGETGPAQPSPTGPPAVGRGAH
jgi:16S rRNA processing protein RimM